MYDECVKMIKAVGFVVCFRMTETMGCMMCVLE
jgi:hypothetical protein